MITDREQQARPFNRQRRRYPLSAETTMVKPPPGEIQASPSLMREGGKLICPGCEVEQDVLAFVPFDYAEKYADQVLPVHRCRQCGHVFALHPNPGGEDA